MTIAVTTGPYNDTVTDGVNETILISGLPSTCGVQNCTYTWVLACPSPALPQSFGGITPSLIAGPGGNINTTGVASGGNVTCGLTLNVTDGSGATNTTTTTVTVKCAIHFLVRGGEGVCSCCAHVNGTWLHTRGCHALCMRLTAALPPPLAPAVS